MQYVIVTGSNGGMGKATVKKLLERGYFVFKLDIMHDEELHNSKNIYCDVTSKKSIEDAFLEVSSITSKIFAIIHFVGIYKMSSLVEIDDLNMEKIFRINFFGAYLINKMFISLMDKDSRIIMTTSELAPLNPLPFTGLYGITKSTLDKYAFSLRMELQLLGIHVSVIRSGAVKTDMLDTSTAELEQFTKDTKLYKYNANRFKKIVESVEAKSVTPEKLAKKVLKIMKKKKPKFNYSINRNFYLLLLNAMPKGFQFYIIRKILSKK